ncbi:putative F-box/FBD/LRR-repeat protein At5g22670 [Silene latifolia]|uniref:putative F-box/FBD/LRR-repeat protein At5g22670 n=1 Tax=Silene latifolia TaxID=37657 RepID=UPI003D77FB74
MSSDKLSKNEDTILIKILSNLPIEKAAATSLLSRRWRYLWTRTTSLRINNSSFHSTKFYTILIHCAKQLSWDNFHTVDLQFTSIVPQFDISLSNNVIHDIVFGQNLRVVNVKFGSGIFNKYEGKLRLPTCLFEMQSLEELHLSNRFKLELPKKGINLPCLKKLDIHVCCSQLQFLSNLVTSCPLLEHLRVNTLLEFSKSCITICSWSLKSLRVEINFNKYDDYYSKPALRILGNMPKLEDIDLQGSTGASISFSKLNSSIIV